MLGLFASRLLKFFQNFVFHVQRFQLVLSVEAHLYIVAQLTLALKVFTTRDNPEQGRLALPVGPDKGNLVASFNAAFGMIKDFQVTVGLRQVLHFANPATGLPLNAKFEIDCGVFIYHIVNPVHPLQ